MSPSFRQEIEDSVHELPGNLYTKLIRKHPSQKPQIMKGTSSKYSSSKSITQFRACNTSDRYEVSEEDEIIVPSESQPSLGDPSQLQVSNSSFTHSVNSLNKLNMSPKKQIIGLNKLEQVAKKDLALIKIEDHISICSSL